MSPWIAIIITSFVLRARSNENGYITIAFLQEKDNDKSEEAFSLPLDPKKHFLLDTNIITYFNVATLGPMPKVAFQNSIDAWKTVQSNPCELFDWENEADFDTIQKTAAAMLGCDADELAFCQSTTVALHMVAQGLVASGYLSKD